MRAGHKLLVVMLPLHILVAQLLLTREVRSLQ